MMLDDVLVLIDNCPNLEINEEQVLLAFSHAKELHVKEMDDIEKYSRMNFNEFIEFIARAGALLYNN